MRPSNRFRATHLAEILRQNERSQSWLARKVGVSVSLMNYIVKGERTMSFELASAIGDVFGLPLFLFCESTSVYKSDTLKEVA